MPTKTVTNNTQQQQQAQSGSNNSAWNNNFAPGSMANYQALQGSYVPALQDLINNPLGNPMFQAMAGNMRAQVGGNNAASMQTLTNNMTQFGGASSPFMASQMARLGRTTSSQQAGGYNNLLIQAMQQRMQGLGMAGSFNPLVTGGNQSQSYTGNMTGSSSGQQTQQQSGLGTWLPQLLSAGLGGAMNFLPKGGGGGVGALPTSSPGSSFAANNPFLSMPMPGSGGGNNFLSAFGNLPMNGQAPQSMNPMFMTQ